MTDPGTPTPPAPPPQKKFQMFATPGAGGKKSVLSTPLFGAFMLGLATFLPWLKGDFKAFDLPVNILWSDLSDYTMDGVWLGWVLLGIAIVGFIAALIPATKSWQLLIVGLLAVVAVGMFFRAALSEDSLDLVQSGAYGAAVGALVMLVPRGK